MEKTKQLCGTLDYSATFEGQALSEDTEPMSYNSAMRQFSIYSEDENLVGQRTITLSAHLNDYPGIRSDDPPISATIEIIDECASLDSIISTEQADPETYYYSGNNPSLQFTLDPFTTSPPDCATITYSCEVISGSRIDIC